MAMSGHEMAVLIADIADVIEAYGRSLAVRRALPRHRFLLMPLTAETGTP